MSRTIDLPPSPTARPDGAFAGGWWHDEPDTDRIVCDLCPRACSLKAGDRGFCFVRENREGEMVLTTYGRSTGFCIDPIEKKPLNHFLPGTSVLSFGTAGCNLGCKFCQNWDISKSREIERLSDAATPEMIAEAARQFGCRSVAFTYNDPVIWAEYAIDVAKACRAVGVKTVAVTAGYITPQARGPFYEVMDAANVDLKGFTEEFYQHYTLSHMQPVLDTLVWLKRESDVWFEITNLVIPQANDSMDEIRQMCDWILNNLGDDVPVHFTAFHPDYRLRDRPRTPPETLVAAFEIAKRHGIKYAYTGNVDDVKHQSTYCPSCGGVVIERNWYELGVYNLTGSKCRHCGGDVAGVYETAPGKWGRKRVPVNMLQFAHLLPVVQPQAPAAITPATTAPANIVPSVPPQPVARGRRWTPDQLARLADFCRSNLRALLRGATPAFYLPDVPDANVAGAVLSLGGESDGLNFVRLTLRGGVPLQASLFSLVEAAAGYLASQGANVSAQAVNDLGLTVLSAPRQLGPSHDASLNDFDSRGMALIVAGTQCGAIAFDPDQTGAALLNRALERLPENERAGAMVFSAAAESTKPSLLALV
jgi:AmmeMemoRadiSam system radical SAM enzyme